jgi:hypothetical protein
MDGLTEVQLLQGARSAAVAGAGDRDMFLVDLDFAVDPANVKVFQEDLGVGGAIADGDVAAVYTEEEVALVISFDDEYVFGHGSVPGEAGVTTGGGR